MVLPKHGYDWSIHPDNTKQYNEAALWLKQKLATIDRTESPTTTF
jgi:hypothetical protein